MTEPKQSQNLSPRITLDLFFIIGTEHEKFNLTCVSYQLCFYISLNFPNLSSRTFNSQHLEVYTMFFIEKECKNYLNLKSDEKIDGN